MTEKLEQGSGAWREARENRLTASNFAAAMGINPYQSRQKLYDLLTGTAEPFEGNEMTQWGTDHEPDAVFAYEAFTGEFVEQTGFWVHPDKDWLGASPDGLVLDNCLIECKCKFSQELWDCVPAHYMAQIQGQLEITNRELCDFVSWTPTDLAVFRVTRSTDYWEAQFPLLEQFWNEFNDRTKPKRRKKPVMPDVKVERLT